jgi:ERCC4-related helicase
MEDKAIELIRRTIRDLQMSDKISKLGARQANLLYSNGQSLLLTQSKEQFEFSVDDQYKDYLVRIRVNESLHSECNCRSNVICHHQLACILHLHEHLTYKGKEELQSGKKYTREGMIKRVLFERREKAEEASYYLEMADNLFGEHILRNERSVRYKLTFRNFEQETGYCSCPDFQTNKLGTCKHLMFAFNHVRNKLKELPKRMPNYPFVEIYLDPLNDYQVSWYFPHPIEKGTYDLIKKYFGDNTSIPDDKLYELINLIDEAKYFKEILIRPEVLSKVERIFNKLSLAEIKKSTDISVILDSHLKNIQLFPYQREGVDFAAYREGAIIADEMGLGKTIQAIGVAIAKKYLFDFKKTLVITPASLKDQWKREIEKFSDEKALIAEGAPNERVLAYTNKNAYFVIVNYETVLRDLVQINKMKPDFIILDEAQKIKNYTTMTAGTIKALHKKHSLVITGTPIENRLIDIYSVVSFVDNQLLAPLWEFSYQHCYFDAKLKNKITGYYNLQGLKERLGNLLIRREKADVLTQLPNVSQSDIPIEMHPAQENYHASFSRGIAKILAKKFITPFDMQMLQMLLAKMRMVCDSTYLVDMETNHSPKLEELRHILIDKMDIRNHDRKVLVFSEWKKMNNIIGKMLRDNDIPYVELNGSIPAPKRSELIREFENNPDCKIFLSTEAGGVGLNLQVADTVINFELPWNPAKKNQRIGRIDRIGQSKQNLTVINFITRDSIEVKIATGLMLKQNLSDSVLNAENDLQEIDFSEKGRSQFLDQLRQAFDNEIILEAENPSVDESEEKPDSPEVLAEERKLEQLLPEDKPSELINEQKEKAEPETEEPEPEVAQVTETAPKAETTPKQTSAKEMEQVMNHGLSFLAGLLKMTTQKDLDISNQSISIDEKTGEVTMKFKLPV